jgi:hypothetical protein
VAGRLGLGHPELHAVQHLAGDQPGDRLQAGVGMRADIETWVSVTSSGPMWSAKHQAPRVRRSPAGERAPHRHRP